MSSVIIEDGWEYPQDPSDIKNYTFDWDTYNLGDGVSIVTSTFKITAIQPSADTALVKDNESILAGSRKTALRLSVGTLGAVYEIANKIVTDESPAQTKERSFRLLIQDR